MQNSKELKKEKTLFSKEEIIGYQKGSKIKKEVFGKYGILAKEYLENHNYGKYIALSNSLIEYLHNIDFEADKMYSTMYNNLSTKKEYRKTGNYVTDLLRENEVKMIIENRILNELVYSD